jgi:murein DD-endopeptidase MepM/ murein hydrolase activator NlpD
MQKILGLLKRAFTPVTIMFIPHSHSRPIRLKIPSIGVIASIIFWTIGSVYVLTVAIDTLEYNRMKKRLYYYSGQFLELKSTITALQKAENEFKKLFSLKSKEEVLKNLDATDSGSIDMENLKEQIKVTMETVGEIRDYLGQQSDLYRSTPRGWPANGHITSPYGRREHPQSGEDEFHSGVDIASSVGMPVRATADGIVSFSGWKGGNGNLVVIEHGLGFSTFYGHNKRVSVKVGQKVKRGDIIGYIGSTGNSTGPHVHYEVWRERRPVNPVSYIEGKS